MIRTATQRCVRAICEEVSLPTVGVRWTVLRRLRSPGSGLPADLPGLGRGGRGRTQAEETTQKEHGRRSRHKD